MADLLPCPFCGSHDVTLIKQPGICWVACRTCNTDGPTKDEAREAVLGWDTRTGAKTALDSFIDDVEAADIRDAARYREFFASGLPITFLGVEYRTKAELDAAIDAMKGDQP